MDSLKILIIEDEIIIYMHIKNTLQRLGFSNIYIARTYNEAIEISNKNRIDLVISDINLKSSMDGIDTCKVLQDLYEIPVIFITAYKEKEIVKKASFLNPIGYLLKPYRVDELEVLIELAIQNCKSINMNELIQINTYKYDRENLKIYLDENEIPLTKKESLFIQLLSNNLNSTIPYDTIDKSVWYESNVSDNTRRTFIHRLKNKLPYLSLEVEKNLGIKLQK